jgi:DNA repair protein RadC
MYRAQLYKCVLVKDRVVRFKAEPNLRCHEQAVHILREITKNSPSEQIVVISLNAQGDVIGTTVVGIGGLSGCAVTPREIFRPAVIANACSVIIGHNHPSGCAVPSEEDRKMTVLMMAAGELLGIHVLDHIVVTRTDSRSVSVV